MNNNENASPARIFSNSLADAVEHAAAWTVAVQIDDEYPSSGVLYGPGRVLTAAHLVEDIGDDEKISVVTPDGVTTSAVIRGIHPTYDLALLEIQNADAPGEQSFAQDNHRTGETRVGELVLALARPTNEGIQSSLGVINVSSGTYRPWRGPGIEGVMRSDASRFPGYAGGPLIDVDGAFVGVNVYGVRRQSSLTIPAALLATFMPELEAGKSHESGYLGVRSQVADLSADRASELKRSTGLLVVGMEDDSPAARSGVFVGDIVVDLDGNEVTDHSSLLEALAGTNKDQAVVVNIIRGGELQAIDVTIGARPAGSRKPGRGRGGHRKPGRGRGHGHEHDGPRRPPRSES